MSPDFEDEGLSLLDLAVPLAEHLKLLIIGPILAGLVALGITYLIAPTFTARTSFLPPQQQQSAAASALSSLGALAGLAGAATGIKSPAEQYVALMESATASDRIIDEFKLMQVYDEEYRIDVRKKLAKNVRMAVGRKDGLISVEVDDESPQRAAAMANRYVDELRRLTSQIAITEAQQRRIFFEQELVQTRDKLTAAQQALQASGFNPGAIKAEPKAAAEGYAKLRAEATAAEVRLQALRRAFSDNTPEVQQQLAALSALRGQLAKVEAATDSSGDADYVSRYREFKYQETLFELYARQYELARADESREGALIQVVDVAKPPEKKSWPKRALTAAVTWAGALLLLGIGVLVRHSWRESSREPQNEEKIARLRAAFGRR
ncbi:MAG: lipopolysaccharide biosynthesis protein [Burkholderiales bacterium]|nr:MAG: lipopolysaccharide biosynthesis protein [Burkholderiales bacterium]